MLVGYPSCPQDGNHTVRMKLWKKVLVVKDAVKCKVLPVKHEKFLLVSDELHMREASDR